MDTPLGGAFVSLLLGLLLGLERERAKKAQPLFAGIRTLPLISLCGFFAASAAQKGMPLALPALLLAVGAFGLASYLRATESDAGITSEVAALVAALLGAVVAWGQVPVAASIAVVVTLLLTLKAPLHRLAGRVTGEEVLAIVKFGIVAVVVLPLLPDEPVGPYDALVPRKVGLMVVILSGVSLVGYLLVRILGGRAGWALAGALGGLVSSTATTLSFSSKARDAREQTPALAVGVILASTVLYVRGAVVLGLMDRAVGAVPRASAGGPARGGPGLRGLPVPTRPTAARGRGGARQPRGARPRHPVGARLRGRDRPGPGGPTPSWARPASGRSGSSGVWSTWTPSRWRRPGCGNRTWPRSTSPGAPTCWPPCPTSPSRARRWR